jgi:hypothetical protein
MSNYGAKAIGMGTVRPKRKEMKISLKQRLINWLSDEVDLSNMPESTIERESLQSEGMRFQLYRASGGYVIETTQYDNRTDRRINKMYVITEDKDLGAELGKIVTMEALRA